MKMEALCNVTTPAIELYRCRKDVENDIKMPPFLFDISSNVKLENNNGDV